MSATKWCMCDGGPVPIGQCIGCEDIENSDECPTCEGQGTINPLTAPDGMFVATTTTCPDCDGTGEMQ